MAHRVRPAALVAALLLLASAVRADFVNFESGQVRPLALSPDGSRLYAANTPDNRLEIFTRYSSRTTDPEPSSPSYRYERSQW